MRTISLVIIMFLTLAEMGHAEMTGREIMEIYRNRHELKFETETVEMTLKDKKDKTKERTIVTYSSVSDNGIGKSMLKFLVPADIRGVGLLTWEQESKEDDQWLYLPALKKVKRISSGGKKKSFMGTDLAYEDMLRENLQAHDYELQEPQNIDGNECFVVVATPAIEKQKKDSGYSKRILYIRKDIFFVIRTDFYDKKGKLVKRSVVQELENIKDDSWGAKKFTMTNLKKNHSTIMQTTNRDITTPLEEGFFTKRYLKKPTSL